MMTAAHPATAPTAPADHRSGAAQIAGTPRAARTCVQSSISLSIMVRVPGLPTRRGYILRRSADTGLLRRMIVGPPTVLHQRRSAPFRA